MLAGYETVNIFGFSCFPFLVSTFLINPFLFLFSTHSIFQLRQECIYGMYECTNSRKQTTEQIMRNTYIHLLRKTLPFLSTSALNIICLQQVILHYFALHVKTEFRHSPVSLPDRFTESGITHKQCSAKCNS